MKTKIVARKMELTPAIESYTLKKIAKLDKFFYDDASATVTLSAQKDKHRAEITVFYGMVYRAEIMSEDLYNSIDRAVELMERQIRKQKTKLEKRLKTGAFKPSDPSDVKVEEETEFKIVKVKTYENKPMSPEEAILQMNILGHNFYIFNNSANDGDINVVYRRNDGNYGLIDLR